MSARRDPDPHPHAAAEPPPPPSQKTEADAPIRTSLARALKKIERPVFLKANAFTQQAFAINLMKGLPASVQAQFFKEVIDSDFFMRWRTIRSRYDYDPVFAGAGGSKVIGKVYSGKRLQIDFILEGLAMAPQGEGFDICYESVYGAHESTKCSIVFGKAVFGMIESIKEARQPRSAEVSEAHAQIR